MADLEYLDGLVIVTGANQPIVPIKNQAQGNTLATR